MFLLCVCVCFLKEKYIFLYTFDSCGRVGDKKISTPAISGNKTTFFGLIVILNSVETKLNLACLVHLQKYSEYFWSCRKSSETNPWYRLLCFSANYGLAQKFLLLAFETLLCFLLCFINCEHKATTQRALIFY